ncbi:MAG TPA: TonB-dependent receptor [Bacteroidales bacterium]|nr:TonB-dependent receptor [Bacteroidales bacterium]
MRFYRFLTLLIAFILISISLNAQKGIIRGAVVDESNGEALISVTIVAEGTIVGITTDLDGKFNLSIDPGTYNLKISYISYESQTISNVRVRPGEVTLLDNIRLKQSTIGLSEVTITASASRSSESAITTIRMNSPSLTDGISATSFKRMGDSDAASSMKRVTGVSVEGGKYVYVRGLGDRYTKTILNGVDIPGLDPDRNTMQMDIFPTNLIDNIIVHKSFSAELPADFTGGVIDIAIKDFPDQKKGNISLSSSYNPDFHFKSDFLTYKGGKTDFLGFDDGTRAIPATENLPFFASVLANPSGEQGMRYREILEGFNPAMAAMKQTSLMDYSFAGSFGNQIPVRKITIGYNFGFSYKSNNEFYKDAEYGRYGLSSNPDIMDLEVREFQKGDFGVKSVLLSGLAGFAVKTRNSKYRINIMHLQNGESKAGIFDYTGSDQGSNFSGFQHNLEYSERALTNLLIDGRTTFNTSKWDITWKLSPTISSISDPDARFIRYVTDNNDYRINTESGFPERIWRNLSEINLIGVVHVSKGFMFRGEKARLNFGGQYGYKERDFMIRKFMFNIRNVPLTGDPDEIFRSENLWPLYGTDYTNGTTYEPGFIPSNPNQFNANSSNGSGYLSLEMNLTKRLRTIAGLRVENYLQRYTGQNQQGTIILDNTKLLDETGFFLSVNFIYSLTSNQNIRLSYAKTIARPSFKELSFAEIVDPLSGRTFVGGMFRDADDIAGREYWNGNLVSSQIHNADLRWEIFRKNNQLISISGFYKYFHNPIEIVQYATQTGCFQPRNVGNGQVLGLELELRQNLGEITVALNNFDLTSNISVTRSRIELSLTEYYSRLENARVGQTIEKYREMAGQAPWIINSGITYNGGERGFWADLEAGLYYNVQGTTLQYVGIADRPDIYTLPFHSLNLSLSKTFGNEKRAQIGLKIDNLLNDKRESVFRSFNPTDQFFTKLEPGITYHLKFSYALF